MMMIRGTVTPLGEPPISGKPIIEMEVANPEESDRVESFQLIVDTGFTGVLTLRPAAVAQLRLPFIANWPAVLADGSIGHYAVYAALIVWYGHARAIPVHCIDRTANRWPGWL